ncbi:MAG: hypothetical protein IPL98_16300 [Saprospiraceae bacterium]|nr:hypothetical protein [Saprospiraceae bacterium]
MQWYLCSNANDQCIRQQRLRTGLITRTFSVAPGIIAVHRSVVDCDPFWVATACDQLDDIFWPDCQQLGSSIIGCGARDWSPNNPSKEAGRKLSTEEMTIVH